MWGWPRCRGWGLVCRARSCHGLRRHSRARHRRWYWSRCGWGYCLHWLRCRRHGHRRWRDYWLRSTGRRRRSWGRGCGLGRSCLVGFLRSRRRCILYAVLERFEYFGIEFRDNRLCGLRVGVSGYQLSEDLCRGHKSAEHVTRTLRERTNSVNMEVELRTDSSDIASKLLAQEIRPDRFRKFSIRGEYGGLVESHGYKRSISCTSSLVRFISARAKSLVASYLSNASLWRLVLEASTIELS